MEGILLVHKPKGMMSFSLVSRLRKITQIQKIGHAGTLDPFAEGLMIMLIGRKATKLSDTFLLSDKSYEAVISFTHSTDSFDLTGAIDQVSSKEFSKEELEKALEQFQGETLQTPPMFSAKKVGGKKLCELARKGISIERKATPVRMDITLLEYSYPYAKVRICCSKGTYIRSFAYDLGIALGTHAHLVSLLRIRSGSYLLDDAVELSQIETREALASQLIPV